MFWLLHGKYCRHFRSLGAACKVKSRDFRFDTISSAAAVSTRAPATRVAGRDPRPARFRLQAFYLMSDFARESIWWRVPTESLFPERF